MDSIASRVGRGGRIRIAIAVAAAALLAGAAMAGSGHTGKDQAPIEGL